MRYACADRVSNLKSCEWLQVYTHNYRVGLDVATALLYLAKNRKMMGDSLVSLSNNSV